MISVFSDTFKELNIKESLMQKLTLKIEFTKQSLNSLHEALLEPHSAIALDAILLRFDQSVEIFWRLVEDYLFVHEGFVCVSPKTCMRVAFKLGLMDREETVKTLEMIDLQVKYEHTCLKEDIEEIYRQTGNYWKLMDEVSRRIVEKIDSDIWSRPAEK